MKFVKHETTKLFYNKYLYKIQFRLRLGHVFKKSSRGGHPFASTLNKILDYKTQLSDSESIVIHKRYYQKIQIDKEDIEDAAELYSQLNKLDECKLRLESDSISIYSTDKANLVNIVKNLKTVNYIRSWEPDNVSQALLLSKENIIITNTPNKFEYKVKISNYSTHTSKAILELYPWLEKNRDKVKVTDRSLNSKAREFTIQVKDTRVLLLLQMVAGNKISRIDKIIYKADIDK